MNTQLEEPEYLRLAKAELVSLLAAIDAQGIALDAELENDILTLEFDMDTVQNFVLSSHRAARQLWFAANRQAWHFDFQPESQTWVASKTGEELWSVVNAQLGAALGARVDLAPNESTLS